MGRNDDERASMRARGNAKLAARWSTLARLGPPSARLGVLLCLAGCAGLGSERNLAPLISTHSTAGGGVEIEALGGVVLTSRPSPGAPTDYWAIRPLISHRRVSEEEHLTWFLPPLGIIREKPREYVFQLLPVTRYASRVEDDENTTWSLLTLPGIYWAKTADDRIVRAWFPFAGVVEHFFSYDRASFFLWPLYFKTERVGRKTWHFLFPFLKYSTGNGGRSGHFWPLIGRNRFEGRYDRWFFLWPFFHYQKWKTRLAPEKQGRSIGFMPFFGRARDGAQTSTTVLWPFFGYSENPETGFWAWDGPWPLVRFRHPGDEEGATRRRVWPFFSRYEGDGLSSRYYGWPFFNKRREVYGDKTKDSTSLFPFWRSWDDGTESYRKLWPFFRRQWSEDASFYALPALNPLWRTPIIDEHYAWIWELYTHDQQAERVRDRSWLGLYRRERDTDEDRRSFAGIWARRDFSEGGEAVRETSFLFGLLRFRSRKSTGLALKWPAFPGPGWPLERVPNSLPMAEASAQPEEESP